MRKILIVEDDEVIALALRDGLESEGYTAEVATNGSAGLRAAQEKEFDLIVLDVMLPRQSGFDVCKQLRATGNTTPIIMLTARSLEVEKVQGLNLGADDYITKPFGLMELFARVKAVLRRTGRGSESVEQYRFGEVTLDFGKFEASKNGTPLELSAREFRILKHLIEQRGQVVSREQLLNHVWSYDSFPSTRTVDSHIARLRQKIERAPNDPRFLITVHGIGYKFVG